VQTLLISDLHLQTQQPELTALANALLDKVAPACKTLYIIGDLFEYWLGDDACDALSTGFAARLASLTQGGTRVYLMHGNRDFLLGERYAEQCGATLVRDDAITVEIAGTPTLLMHGDTLCTDDTDYQQFRTMVRDVAWQKAFLSKPVTEREAIAKQIRDASKERGAEAHRELIADINEDALRQAVQAYAVDHVIHGHTHRPARHLHTVGNTTVQRMVLGDWHADHAVVAVDDGRGCSLQRWDGYGFESVSGD